MAVPIECQLLVAFQEMQTNAECVLGLWCGRSSNIIQEHYTIPSVLALLVGLFLDSCTEVVHQYPSSLSCSWIWASWTLRNAISLSTSLAIVTAVLSNSF